MSDDDKTIGGIYKGPDREPMDAVWQALSERDRAVELCESWSSIAVEHSIDRAIAQSDLAELRASILNLLCDEDLTSGALRRALRMMVLGGSDGGT